MAERVFARTTTSCKRIFPHSSIDTSPEIGPEADAPCLAASTALERTIRTQWIDGRPYIMGLEPVVRIDAITDIPDDLKRLLSAAPTPQRPAYGPVFSAAEITAGRKLIATLDRGDVTVIGDVDDGVPGVGTVSTALCRKLEAIGMVTLAPRPDGFDVRRAR